MLSQLSDHGVSLVKNVPLDDEENVLKVCVPFDLLYFITETASSPSFSTKSVSRVKKKSVKKEIWCKRAARNSGMRSEAHEKWFCFPHSQSSVQRAKINFFFTDFLVY